MIRFQRTGRTNAPAFRIVLVEKGRSAKAGNITEQLGTYNPKSKALTIDAERVKEWISKGAQPTDSIRNLLITKGILEGKKVNVLPKKTPIVSEEKKVEEKVVEKTEEVAEGVAEEVAADVATGAVADAVEEVVTE